MENYRLLNGVQIPCMGTGPSAIYRIIDSRKWQFINKLPIFGNLMYRVIYRLISIPIEHKYVKLLANSIKQGYRLIDFSCAYGDGRLIGRAIRKSGVNRKDIFIVSKASNGGQFNNEVREEFMRHLSNLGVDYIDIYMFHWPVTGHFIKTYKEIEALYKEGLIKSIGVCNCQQHHIESIIKECEIMPMVNEFEVHPLFTQKPLVEYCHKHGMQVIAYTPLAINDYRLRNSKILHGIAAKYKKNIQQIILRWHIQNKIIPIPFSFNNKHNQSNFEVFDFELSKEEMDIIDGLNINSRLRYDPDNCDFTIL